MSFLSSASEKSILRGYNYYTENRVLSACQISDCEYEGIVEGSGGIKYNVHINLKKPKTSRCSCPYAEGKMIICKHKIALFFSIFPDEAEKFYKDYQQKLIYEEDEEDCEAEADAVIKYIMSLNKARLQDTLIDIIMNGPDWQYDDFLNSIEDNGDDYF